MTFSAVEILLYQGKRAMLVVGFNLAQLRKP